MDKRLDHFLMVEYLVDEVGIFWSWVVNVKIYDYMPILLQLEGSWEKILYPFKFNHGWLEFLDFNMMIRDK